MSVDFLTVFFFLAVMLVLVKAAGIAGSPGRKKHKHAEFRRQRPYRSGGGGEDADIHALWESRHQNIPLKFYGGGADHPFDHYFTGISTVSVNSVDEIVAWLLECEYVPDPVQFQKRDHWQHPLDFEVTRKGDCEDFALWAWRKLVELGHEAEFMVGKWVRGSHVGTHAWVVLEHAGERYLFESTGRAPDRVIRPYAEAFRHYIPFASVDRELRKKVYNGLAHWVMRQA